GGNDATTNTHYGVWLQNGAKIQSTGTGASAGNISITGTGGIGNGSGNAGVRLEGATTDITSVDGNVSITGVATTSAGGTLQQDGLRQLTGSGVHITGTGSLTMTGTAGSTDGAIGVGLRLSGTMVLSGAQNALVADRMFLDTINLSVTSTGAVTLRPNTNLFIDIGSVVDTTAATLELSNLELSRIAAPTINIGNASSGPINITNAVTRAATTNFNLTSSGSISFTTGSFNTNGGNLTLTPGGTGGVNV